MIIHRWFCISATAVTLVIMVAGSVFGIYLVVGRSALGGADLNIGKAIAAYNAQSTVSPDDWNTPWPPVPEVLRAKHSILYQTANHTKLSIRYRSTAGALTAKAVQPVRYVGIDGVMAMNHHLGNKRNLARPTSPRFHIQF